MNQVQRKHAAARIGQIIHGKLSKEENVPSVKSLHLKEIRDGKAKRMSATDTEKLIKGVATNMSPFNHSAVCYRNADIEISQLYKINPAHEKLRLKIQKQNHLIVSKNCKAKEFVLKQQDAIILGSSEEALAALKTAENYKL
tara:strand:+ start:33 stop:458 length:426 start_codon:yes stop_codon:yes gene_type:complete